MRPSDSIVAMKKKCTLFVWRRKDQLLDFDPKSACPDKCPCCGNGLSETGHDEPDDDYVRTPTNLACRLCGWELNYVTHSSWVNPYEPIFMSEIHDVTVLQEFEVDSTNVALAEMGTFLRNNYSIVYNISWRRFEQLAEDIFKQHGFRTLLTQPAKDGGADILLLENESRGVQAIVECKKYSPHRKLGIAAVRTLVGAAVKWGVGRAYLVTTSDFTADAKISVHDYRTRGYDIDLVAAGDLVKLLGVYNEKLPPLYALTAADRESILFLNQTPRL